MVYTDIPRNFLDPLSGPKIPIFFAISAIFQPIFNFSTSMISYGHLETFLFYELPRNSASFTDFWMLSPSILTESSKFFFPDNQKMISYNFYFISRVRFPNRLEATGQKPIENGSILGQKSIISIIDAI